MIDVVCNKIGLGLEDADFSSLLAWESTLQGSDPEVLFVGIVRGGEYLHSDIQDLREVVRFVSLGKYLLIHTTGRIIASKFDDDEFLDEEALLEDSGAYDWNNKTCKDAIRAFISKHTDEPVELYAPVYADLEVNKKVELIVPSFELINAELIQYLAKNPDLLEKLHWRKFEELLDELLKAQGYETSLGPGTKDGGVDLRLIQRADFGEMLILVQAKKHAPHRKIQIEPIRALYGCVEDEEANKGLLVSTSEFTRGAKNFALKHHYRIELIGPNELRDWLRRHGNHA